MGGYLSWVFFSGVLHCNNLPLIRNQALYPWRTQDVWEESHPTEFSVLSVCMLELPRELYNIL